MQNSMVECDGMRCSVLGVYLLLFFLFLHHHFLVRHPSLFKLQRLKSKEEEITKRTFNSLLM